MKEKRKDPVITYRNGSWHASKGNIVGSEGAIAVWNYKGRSVILTIMKKLRK